MGFAYCEFPECLDRPDELTHLVELPEGRHVGLGRVTGGFDAGGVPLAFFQTEEVWSETQLLLVRCVNTDCSATQEPDLVTTAFGYGVLEPGLAADGSVVAIYQANPAEGDMNKLGGAVTVLLCDGTDCAGVSPSVVHENPPGATSPFDGVVGPDGLVRLVWTTREGFVFAACTDPACTQSDISEVVPYRAPSLRMVTAGDGAAIVVTGESRDASQGQNIAPGVWLLRCGSPPCTPPEPPKAPN